MDCSDTSKLINDKRGNRWGFVLLSLLTKLHLDCLKQIRGDDRSKFPANEEKILFDKIKAQVQSLKSQLVQLDARRLKFIELALIDYEGLEGVNPNKQSLVKFLLSSYKAIAETISTKETPKGTLSKEESKKGELLKKWKGIIDVFDKDIKKNEVSVDHTNLGKVEEYFNVRRDADSLHRVCSAIDLCTKYFNTKGTTIEEKKLFLRKVLYTTGEYLKSTLDTPSLSDNTRQSLEKQVPVGLLTNLRDQQAHNQIISTKLSNRDIKKLLDESLIPMREIFWDKIVKVEKDFIQHFVKENASKITDGNVRNMISSYASEGVTELRKYIEQIKDKGGIYHSLDVNSKRLVDEMHFKVLMMKSSDSSTKRGNLSGSEIHNRRLKIQNSIMEYISQGRLNAYDQLHQILRECGLYQPQLHNAHTDAVKITKVIDCLGGASKGSDDLDGLLQLRVLGRININVDGNTDLKSELERYFDLKSFKNKILYSEFKQIKLQSLKDIMKSIKEPNEDKDKLDEFFKSGSGDLADKPDKYEELVNNLKLLSTSKEKLLSYSVGWRKRKCAELLEKNPVAVKKLYDGIIKGKTESWMYKELALQYVVDRKLSSEEVKKIADDLEASISAKIEEIYSSRLKALLKNLKILERPYEMQSQFIEIYSLLERTRDGHDPFLLRNLRNYLAHDGQSERFGEQFVQLIGEAVKKIDISKDITLSSFNNAVSAAQLELQLSEIQTFVPITSITGAGPVPGSLDFCAGQGSSRSSARKKRSIAECLFSREDVEKFTKGNIEDNGVDKVVIDSEKFLTYVKSSDDEGKNAQLIKFVADKSIVGDYGYLVERVIQDQGYERYIQNERIEGLYSDISRQDVSSIIISKSKGRLITAAGRIQLIRGIHGTIVSCIDGSSTDCGLSVTGMAWSFASQPIENVIVKAAPKAVDSAGHVVGKMIPGTLGGRAKFTVTFAGAKYGSKIAKGVGGAVGGVFDVVDIGMSASSLVDCKKRENSNNPCTEKEIRDNIASILFSGVSFISGIIFAALSMPGVGTAVGLALMIAQGIYSGVSNIIEYQKMYKTNDDENWSIFWRTLLFQPMADDVQHLKIRSDIVNYQAKVAWKVLNDSPSSVFACAIGLGTDADDMKSLLPEYGKILMNRTDADTTNFSRVIPHSIQNAIMLCLPQSIGKYYEKGIRQSVPTAVHYCENTMVIADERRLQNGTTIIYNLESIDKGTIVGSSKLVNYFLIFAGSTTITGGDNTVNRFVLFNREFFGSIRGGYNATNIIDLSKFTSQDFVLEVIIDYNSLSYGNLVLTLFINSKELIYDYIDKNADVFDYIYIGMENRQDNIVCTYNSQRTMTNDDRHIFISSGGGLSKDKKDTVDNCKKVEVLPYTKVSGAENDYTFYIKTAGYRAKELYSEIDVEGTGTIIFPETSLLDDCDEIAYSSSSNTLSLKIRLVQGNQYTIEIKSYINTNSHQPNFILIDKNGSNVIPKIKKLESSFTKINSFELHAEYFLDDFDAIEKHYNKILRNSKDYKVFGVLTEKLQSQSDSTLRRVVFGSSGEDIINFDQNSTFAIGGSGSDIYIVDSNTEKREITIDNNSDDKILDVLMLPEVPEGFSCQRYDLRLNYNNTRIQVRNYLRGSSYRHLVVMNSMGETFIPYVESMSYIGSAMENGKLLPFLQATPTQNIFLLPKDLQDDHVVIDSRLEDIERYRDKDDLLLVRKGEIPFIIKIEDFYNDPGKWKDINFLLWDKDIFSPYSGLYQKVNEVMEYRDRLKSDYEKSVKEYVIDFTQSVNITHNQNDTLSSVGQDEERIGIVILKDITPDRIQVSSSDRDLVFSDKLSKHVINLKNWNISESYRISTLEFDLGLEPIIISRLDRFSSSSIAQVQNLIDEASRVCKKKDALQIDIKLPIAAQDGDFSKVKALLDRCASINAKGKDGFTPLHYGSANGNLEAVKYMVEKGADFNVQCDRLHTPLQLAAMYGHLDIVKFLKERGAAINLKDQYERSPLHSAAINGKLEVVKYLVEEGANIDDKDKSGRTPLDFAVQKSYKDIVEFLKETPKQRKRRHHHGDHRINHLSRNPHFTDLASSGGTRLSSWIGGLFVWVNKGSERVKGLAGDWLADNTAFKAESEAKILTSAVVDTSGTILLLDTLIRKVTGQKHILSNIRDISVQEANGHAINIAEGFEKTIKRAARNSKISMRRFNIDFTKVQGEVTKKILSGRYSEILGVLNSYVQDVCNDSEVGNLSMEEFSKFVSNIDSGLGHIAESINIKNGRW